MKIIHLSDLHIGKRINEFSMLEDQKYILVEIMRIIKAEAPDAVVIAGDVYDKSIPSAEAVTELDDFIFKLSEEPFETFIISGNHDSSERIAFGSRIMIKKGIHLSPVYNGKIEPFSLKDEFGEVDFYMLPFIKPIVVRRFFEDESERIETYTDAIRTAIENMNIDQRKRNILIAHQFVTGSEKAGSEELSVGGSDNVDKSVFDPFDYVALGHIHGSQNISEKIRYCGTPLKYSFSEEKHKKSVTVVEINRKGTENIIRTVPLVPKRDMRTVRGNFDEIYDRKFETDDYIRIVLTDENEIENAMSKLRGVYRNVMVLEYDNKRTMSEKESFETVDVEDKNELDLFDDFYEKQNGTRMNDEQREYMKELIEEILEEENASD